MTFSNRMTILRGLASLMLIPVLMIDDQLTRLFALLIFTLAAFTDYYDGRLARLRNENTPFGMIADPIADKALTGVCFIAISILDAELVPFWMTGLILVREFVITVYRFRELGRGRVLGADRWGKWKTGFQMTVIPYCLLAIALFSGPEGLILKRSIQGTWIETAAYKFGYALALFTTALTVWSGAQYLWKNRNPAPAVPNPGGRVDSSIE